MMKLIRNCEKLATEGILMELSSGHTLFDRCYFAPNFNESDAKYGKYDFIADGFESIIDRLSPSVLPVVVEKVMVHMILVLVLLLGITTRYLQPDMLLKT